MTFWKLDLFPSSDIKGKEGNLDINSRGHLLMSYITNWSREYGQFITKLLLNIL
jgi:hypothetical protein